MYATIKDWCLSFQGVQLGSMLCFRMISKFGDIIGIIHQFSVVCKLILFPSRCGIANNTYSGTLLSITKGNLGDILVIHIRELRTFLA
jgi:hypothetical protein